MALRVGIDSHGAEIEGEGNATYTRNLIGALGGVPGDHALTLFAADTNHPFYRGLPGPGLRVVGVPQGRGLLRIAVTLGHAARQAGADCLHVQYMSPLGWRRPLVVTVHDLGFLHLPHSFPISLRIGLRVLVAHSVRRAAAIITCSEFVRRDIEARYPAAVGKVTTIPLGVAPAFHPRPPAETASVLARYGVQPGFVFALGRLNRRKNLERLLRAYGRLRADGLARVPLLIGGKPDYGVDEVLQRAKLTADPSAVRFLGLIPQADLPHFYCGAACFAYPSLFEGFGLPLVESMACGTAVLAADRTALPELVGDAGVLVDPESVEAIAEGLGRLVSDAELARELGRRGLERSRRYSWPETARRTLETYRAAARTA